MPTYNLDTTIQEGDENHIEEHLKIAQAVNQLGPLVDGKVSGLNGAAGLWIGLQSEYDALGTYSAQTAYFIRPAS